MADRRIELTIDSRPSEVRLVAVAVRALCAEFFPHRDRDLVELAVVEAASNAIEHAYRGRPGNPVIVRLHLGTRRLKIEVEDHGIAMPAETLAARNAMPAIDATDLAALPEGGFGLPILHAVADALDYRPGPGRNVLEFTFHTPPSSKGAPRAHFKTSRQAVPGT